MKNEKGYRLICPFKMVGRAVRYLESKKTKVNLDYGTLVYYYPAVEVAFAVARMH